MNSREVPSGEELAAMYATFSPILSVKPTRFLSASQSYCLPLRITFAMSPPPDQPISNQPESIQPLDCTVAPTSGVLAT